METSFLFLKLPNNVLEKQGVCYTQKVPNNHNSLQNCGRKPLAPKSNENQILDRLENELVAKSIPWLRDEGQRDATHVGCHLQVPCN